MLPPQERKNVMTRILAILILLAACTFARHATAATVTVYAFNFDFSINPQSQPIADAVINVGDTIRWVKAQGNHTTTSVMGSAETWNGELSSSSPTFDHTFTATGVHVYYCIPHGTDNGDGTAGGMSGTITVLAPNTGACCLPGDTCSILSQNACQSQGGVYQGNNSTCSPNPCVIDVGACCMPNGSCVELTEAQCIAQGGLYQGNEIQCGDTFCSIQLTPFVDPLPIPALAQPVSGVPGGEAYYEMYIREVQQQLHRDLPPTTVWGYGGTYPGPTIIAKRNLPVTVRWINDLRYYATGELRNEHYLPVDLCLNGPDELGSSARTVSHLHGGHVEMASDGYPEWTQLPGENVLYTYPNNQLPATLWYHDHAMGITRLNVIMGLAGFYILTDDFENNLNLPGGEFQIGLAIQDRQFNHDGSLRYPALWEEQFFGDNILVNGKVWPYLNVKQGKYRFRMLNGSTSRTYTLSLSDHATFHEIGTEGGLLGAPVVMQHLTIMPGERADVIIDFAPYTAGTEIILTNSAPAPYPGTPGVGVIPNVLKFVVQNQVGDIDPLPATLRPVEPLLESNATVSRDMLLQTTGDACTGMRWTINGLGWDDVTEFPRLGKTEIWRFINWSAHSHPMHMHLAMFLVLDRQNFEMIDGIPTPVGDPIPPDPSEMGWKDTVRCDPDQITRVISKFEDYTGHYAYHCHILEHEEHEMMRQMMVRPACLADVSPIAGDDVVNVIDLLAVINGWGACPGSPCFADVTGDNTINVQDLLMIINNWGPCP
jgi:spore coat protein A, manganese oxidase